MQITNLKNCLAISLFLLDLLGMPCAADITFAGVEISQDFNSIQTAVSDSNTSNMIAADDGAQSQNSNLSNGNALAIQPTDQNDTEERPSKASDFDSKENGLSLWTSNKMLTRFYIAGKSQRTMRNIRLPLGNIWRL